MKSGVSEQARDYPTPTTEPRQAGPGMQAEAHGEGPRRTRQEV